MDFRVPQIKPSHLSPCKSKIQVTGINEQGEQIHNEDILISSGRSRAIFLFEENLSSSALRSGSPPHYKIFAN